MDKKLILVDMDDTLENLTEAWINYANRRFGTAVSPGDIYTWDPSEAFDGVPHQAMYDLLLEEELYLTVKPLDGAVNYLERLILDGHDVYVVTNTEYQIAKAKMDNVLFRYFPFIEWKKVILTANKTIIKGDILIDDAPHNLIGGTYEKILFTAPHNRRFDAVAHGVTRVDNWEQAYAEISKICARGKKPEDCCG